MALGKIQTIGQNCDASWAVPELRWKEMESVAGASEKLKCLRCQTLDVMKSVMARDLDAPKSLARGTGALYFYGNISVRKWAVIYSIRRLT